MDYLSQQLHCQILYTGLFRALSLPAFPRLPAIAGLPAVVGLPAVAGLPVVTGSAATSRRNNFDWLGFITPGVKLIALICSGVFLLQTLA